jgi:hypothetical protein
LGIVGAVAETQKISEMMRGVTFCSATINRNINSMPMTKPAAGEVIIGRTIFGQRPAWAPCASVSDHLSTLHFPPAAARAAPHNPPISA